MGLHDRDYIRGNDSGGSATGSASFTMVQWLLILNATVFVVDHIFLGASTWSRFSLQNWGYYSSFTAISQFQIWRFFTYQFLHAGFYHLVVNMIGLYFFGPLIEHYWGRRRFLAFYLLCGASGAVLMTALSNIPGLLMAGPSSPLVGASGSIYGILICAAMIYPNQVVQLIIPPIPLKLKTFALGLVSISLIVILLQWDNAGGEAAHLGGAILGFLLVRNPGWLAPFAGGFKVIVGGRDEQEKTRDEVKVVGKVSKAEIDRILDKISSKGMDSLTKQERQILEQAKEDFK